MDERTRKRIITFYVGGVFNLAVGLYLLFFGQSLLPGRQSLWLAIVFLVFAAIDLYFPSVLKKRIEARQKNAGSQSPIRKP